MRITNKEASTCVYYKIDFKGSNLFGATQGNLYVVYSYGPHWPLFVYSYDDNSWYENEDRYSVTTSKHHSQAHPGVRTTRLPVHEMLRLVDAGGYLPYVVERINHG